MIKRTLVIGRTAWDEKMKQGNKSAVARLARRFVRDESGATAIEYAILVSAIAGVIVAIVYAVGTKTQAQFTTLDTEMSQLP